MSSYVLPAWVPLVRTSCPQAAVTMPGGAFAILTAMLYPSEPDDDFDSEGGVGGLNTLPEGGSMLSVASPLDEMLIVSTIWCWRHSRSIARISANSLGDKGAPAILGATGQKKTSARVWASENAANCGIPGVPSDAVIQVLGNVYGQNDAPSAWHKTFDSEACQTGWMRSKLDPCLHTLRDEKNQIEPTMWHHGCSCSNTAVGGAGKKFEKAIATLKARFPYRKWRTSEGEFCGAYYAQDAQTGDIHCLRNSLQKLSKVPEFDADKTNPDVSYPQWSRRLKREGPISEIDQNQQLGCASRWSGTIWRRCHTCPTHCQGATWVGWSHWNQSWFGPGMDHASPTAMVKIVTHQGDGPTHRPTTGFGVLRLHGWRLLWELKPVKKISFIRFGLSFHAFLRSLECWPPFRPYQLIVMATTWKPNPQDYAKHLLVGTKKHPKQWNRRE